MSHFAWDDEYKTGHAVIDAQHRHLFEIANLLVDSESPEEMKVLLLELFKHTREHFRSEESLMKSSAYPRQREHSAMHDELLDRLVLLGEKVQLDQWNENMLADIAQWFVDHIRESDMQLADFLGSLSLPKK
jgi:hemerythrin